MLPEAQAPSRPPVLRRVLAVAVLLAAAALAVHFLIGLIVTIFWILVGVVVVVAVLWALKTLA